MLRNNFAQASQRLQRAILRFPALWLLLICLIVYGRGLGGDFVIDDWPVVKENSHITDTRYLSNYFTRDVWSNTEANLTNNFGGYSLYRPLFLTTLNLGYQLWGYSSLAFHTLNLILHAINTLLVFYLILGLLPDRARTAAFFGAALFGVHPVHVESVAWISGITDPLASLFMLSGFLLYRRYVRTENFVFSGLALVCFSAGLLSKEVAVFFPLLLVSNDWLEGKFALKRYLPYLGVLAIYFLARSAALEHALDLAEYDIAKIPLLIDFFFRYIQTLIIPWPLDFNFLTPPPTNYLATATGAAAAISGLALLPWALRDRQTCIPISYAWFVIPLLPALPVALMHNGIFAIRALYLPCVGLALFSAWAYQFFAGKKLIVAALWAVIPIFATTSMLEIEDWKDDESVFSAVLARDPNLWWAYSGLAEFMERKGQNEKAVSLYIRASELTKNEGDLVASLGNIGRVFGQNGDVENSEKYYRKILDFAPNYAGAWIGLGNNALTKQDNQQALKFYQKALQADPQSYIASYNLALTYRRLGDIEKAQYFESIARQLQQQPSQ